MSDRERIAAGRRRAGVLIAAAVVVTTAGCGSFSISGDAEPGSATVTASPAGDETIGERVADGPTATGATATSPESTTPDAAPTETAAPAEPAAASVDPEVVCADADTPDPDAPGPGSMPPPDAVVVLVDRDGVQLCLGPALVTGAAIESAIAVPDAASGWRIDLVFTEDGIDDFNEAAGRCAPPDNDPAVCPTMRLAIVDGTTVATAPTVQAAGFERDQIVVSGNFDQSEAQLLAASFERSGLVIRPVLLELGS